MSVVFYVVNMIFGGVWGWAERPILWLTPPGELLGLGFGRFPQGLIENEGGLIDRDLDPIENGGL
jgi:hypothetical protein